MKKDYPRKGASGDSFRSDKWLLDVFNGWFDPCPYDPEYSIDGLTLDWQNYTYVNPPYSNPLPWVKKAIQESRAGKTVVMLLKHDSSTKWWQLLHEANAKFLPIIGRLKYQTGRACAFPSILVVLSGVE
tara:strand:- start:1624 stop:2010 length:387 start_codon:yes stop_codon:yes gene_type:complete